MQQLEVNSCKEEARRPFKKLRKFGDACDTECRGRKGEEGGEEGERRGRKREGGGPSAHTRELNVFMKDYRITGKTARRDVSQTIERHLLQRQSLAQPCVSSMKGITTANFPTEVFAVGSRVLPLTGSPAQRR